MLKLTQEEFEGVPAQVVVEVLLAAILCMWGENQPLGQAVLCILGIPYIHATTCWAYLVVMQEAFS